MLHFEGFEIAFKVCKQLAKKHRLNTSSQQVHFSWQSSIHEANTSAVTFTCSTPSVSTTVAATLEHC